MRGTEDCQRAPLDDAEMTTWHALIRAHSAVVRRLEAELEAEHGLSLPAYEVLSHLSTAPDQRLRMTDLAKHAILTPSGLTRLVDKLARDGLVEREKCNNDARVVFAVLTPRGRERLVSAYPTHLRGVRQHLIDWLTPEQQEGLADALGELANGCRAACTEAEVAEAEELEAQCAGHLDAELAADAAAATPAGR
jgi:DNA-binding MarR family transcriptional regulator